MLADDLSRGDPFLPWPVSAAAPRSGPELLAALLVALALLVISGCAEDAQDTTLDAGTTPDGGGGTAPDGGTDPDGGTIPDGIPVPLSSIIEDGAADRIVVTFDRTIGATGDGGFTIRGGDDLIVTATEIAGPVLTLHLSAVAEYLQNAITWSYDEATGGIMNLRELRLIHVENQIAAPPQSGTEYFVSPSGSASNSGLSEGEPWSMAHAVASAQPGDKVWVKAGSYGNLQLDFDTSGTATERIVFEGYQTSTAGVPDPVTTLYYDYTPSGVLDPNELPLFDGGDETGFGFDIRGLRYVTFRNLTFTRYQKGIFGGWEPANGADDPARAVKYCLFERVVVTNTGGGGDGGAGIQLGEKDHNEFNTVRDCVGQNASMVGFGISGKGNLVRGCRSYCDRDNSSGAEAQDYYFGVKGVESVHLDNLAHRVIETEHGGHGWALRGETPSLTQYNLIQDCTAINMAGAYELRNETSAYNVIRDCTSMVDGAIDGESSGGIQYSGGAHHNLVERFSAQGVSIGISFKKNIESIGSSCGHDNIVRNSQFYGMPAYEGSHGYSHKHAIHGSAATTESNPELTNNQVINCTFHDFSYFLRLYPETAAQGVTASGNEIINCSISTGLYFKHPDTIAEDGFTFHHCNLFEADPSDGGFAPIIGTNGNVSLDPLYADAASFDFRLQAGSGNLDGAMDRDDVYFDFDGKERPQAGDNDIGAFER